jgi:hypothetical protein
MPEARALCDAVLPWASSETEEHCLEQVGALMALGVCSTAGTTSTVTSICTYTAASCTTGLPATGASCFAASDGVLCPLPTQELVADFTYAGGSADPSVVRFGDSSTLSGSGFVYPDAGNYPLASDVANSNWHIKGTVGDLSGFGIYFDQCDRLDASKYRGISFKISGSVAQGNAITFTIGTLNDTIAASWLRSHGDLALDGAPGRCIPTSGTNQSDQSSCASPTKSIPVTTTPTVQRVLWSDFEGGKPETSVAPAGILNINWLFPIPAGAGTSSPTTYDVDIVIDDLMFIS